jgi:hypothetical protein
MSRHQSTLKVEAFERFSNRFDGHEVIVKCDILASSTRIASWFSKQMADYVRELFVKYHDFCTAAV